MTKLYWQSKTKFSLHLPSCCFSQRGVTVWCLRRLLFVFVFCRKARLQKWSTKTLSVPWTGKSWGETLGLCCTRWQHITLITHHQLNSRRWNSSSTSSLVFTPVRNAQKISETGRPSDMLLMVTYLFIFTFFFFVIRFSCIYNILSADWKSTSQTPATAARSPSGSVIFTTTWTSAWESQSLTAPAWTRGGRMAGKTAPVTEWAEGCWDAAAMKGTLKKNHHYQSANLLRGFFCDSCSWNT